MSFENWKHFVKLTSVTVKHPQRTFLPQDLS